MAHLLQVKIYLFFKSKSSAHSLWKLKYRNIKHISESPLLRHLCTALYSPNFPMCPHLCIMRHKYFMYKYSYSIEIHDVIWTTRYVLWSECLCSPPSKLTCWNLIPNVTEWGGVLRVSRSGEGLLKEQGPYRKPQGASQPFLHEQRRLEGRAISEETSFHQTSWAPGLWIYQTHKLWEIYSCYLSVI